MPRLKARRSDHDDEVVRATLGPFVCTWDDLPQVLRPQTSTSTDLLFAAQLLTLGGLLLSFTAPLA